VKQRVLSASDVNETVGLMSAEGKRDINTAQMIETLQATMADDVGPYRDAVRLDRALAKIEDLTRTLGDQPIGDGKAFDMQRLDWFDLRNMLTVARVVAEAARARGESRGAHQREDAPDTLPQWTLNQVARLNGQGIEFSPVPVPQKAAAQ
jgi:succinate dehydrogenase/fumarate reductase flavoprotein subunit